MAKLAPAQTRFDWKKVLSALKNVLYVLLLLHEKKENFCEKY